jgi:outer membrane protein assembly factor BamE (lipoprotein component of BamABCDE complex)
MRLPAMAMMAAAVAAAGVSCGCAIQRAQVANDAQSKMIGLTKEQVLSCMGPPVSKAAEGTTEVWSYGSGNNHTTISTFGNVGRGTYSGVGVGESRYCTINVTMENGHVARMNYVGPTGGLLTQGEQCAFAVQNCL